MKKINRILELLDRSYGMRSAFRRSHPVDELVRTILSQNTSDINSLAAFAVLKKNFSSWEDLMGMDTAKLARLIKHAGLANIKAKRIKEVLCEIRRREGCLTLKRLDLMNAKNALSYLKSIKGVGPKTAACVLLFSFGKPVMPVDTHIFRVTKRLGLISGDLGIEEAHGILSGMIPKSLIYDFHLGIIEHGRKTCKAQNPKCGVCLLYGLCKFQSAFAFKRAQLNASAD